MFPGIADRMSKEITALAPSAMKIKVVAPPVSRAIAIANVQWRSKDTASLACVACKCCWRQAPRRLSSSCYW
jgi:hypothetical protein